MRVTHPFHPLFGRDLEFVKRRRNWRLDRVYYCDEAGELGSLPAGWTDLVPVDVCVAAAAGRVPFRIADLLELADRVREIRSGGCAGNAEAVQEIAP
ncbi:MAG TPA: DUF5372 family protein [Pseudonocardiaceae bacterium]|nr:DUF5372 family protein [Pseudonocardiaceae bacterium]